MRGPAVRCGLSRPVVVAAFFSAVLFGLASGTGVAEPEAEVRLRWSWQAAEVEAEGRGPGGTLDLHVLAGSRANAATLTVRVPGPVEAAVLTAPGSGEATSEITADGTRILRLDLGKLEAGRALPLRFDLTAAPGSGGVVSFSVSGTGADGRAVRGAAGVAVGRPGEPGEVRHGAREFPGRTSGGAGR